MGENSGKYFDVKATTAFFNDVASSFDDYSYKLVPVHSSLNDFVNSHAWQGTDAISGKVSVSSVQNVILGDILDIHNIANNVCSAILEKFKLEVDSASDARIDYDSLETINNNFHELYMDFNSNSKTATTEATSANARFSKYGNITQPEFEDGNSAYIDLCGGDESKSGYIYECMDKLVKFDAEVLDMIKTSGLKTKTGLSGLFMASRTKGVGSSSNNAVQLSFNPQNLKGYQSVMYPGAYSPEEIELYTSILSKGLDKVGGFFTGFIPKYVSNRDVLDFFEYMRYNRFDDVWSFFDSKPWFATSISQEKINKHYNDNKNYLATSGIYTPGQYIENQAYWGDVEFGKGKSNMSYSGCEVIASINALTYLEGSLSAEEAAGVIKSYEENGIVNNGEFGTSPIAIQDYFDKQGYVTHSTTSTDPSDLEKVANESDVMIITVYNDEDDISAGVHTMCITRDSNGQYVLHNSYIYNGTDANGNKKYVERTGKSVGDNDGFNSVQEVVDSLGNSSVIMLTGIEKK